MPVRKIFTQHNTMLIEAPSRAWKGRPPGTKGTKPVRNSIVTYWYTQPTEGSHGKPLQETPEAALKAAGVPLDAPFKTPYQLQQEAEQD